jgi:hypothetical protein
MTNLSGEMFRGDKEHMLDRFARLSINYTIVYSSEIGIWLNFNKSKKMTSRTSFYGNPVTKLRKCLRCGIHSTPKKIQQRYLYGFGIGRNKDASFWAEANNICYPMMCMGCYNKSKPISENLIEANEIRLLAGRVGREISKVNKRMKAEAQTNQLESAGIHATG